ncbi:MAG: type IV secretory system conjugative DNA transfer family protein [Bacilli bacterium]|nr:type IV secretory system conjugative DNA transfer family protein [Bacilli bacterium]
MGKKVGILIAMILGCLILAIGLSLACLLPTGLITFTNNIDQDFILLDQYIVFFFILFMLITIVIFCKKISDGRFQEIIVFISSELVVSIFFGFIIYVLIRCGFVFSDLDWIGFFRDVVELKNFTFHIVVACVFVFLTIVYAIFVNKNVLDFFRNGSLRGKGKLHSVKSNLENSRWMNKKEKNKLFKPVMYSKLKDLSKDGIPVAAATVNKGKDLEVRFNSPCHALVIGSTGSGKTTTFVSPMIQLLAATKANSSMVITDPKGELFNLHSKYLEEKGYDVKVIDLRDTYSSYRWNPLESIFDNFHDYAVAYKSAYSRNDNPESSGLKLCDPIEEFKEEWFEFKGQGFATYEHLLNAVKIYKKKIYDEVYEDLNDLVSVLVPVENEKDPTWEKGARSITLAVLLAMLEDYQDGTFGMTKEKFNFFNLTKILQNSSNDYAELRKYFMGRHPLSRAYSLAKQVVDAAPQTRASYMSIVYEKLTMFNDSGICALTSASDFNSAQLAEKPTALFLKIPDEKDTRHNLAAIFILNIYKTLIKVASTTDALALPRNVYFIMDEFGNLPKIEKFDKFITVGRSRKIWFCMIVQSYSQLNNVYGETVADIVKGNCGIKMFIGSNDMNTCKEYSELCGNITVVTGSTSTSTGNNEVSFSSQTQVRPLIYPSELQRLNKPGDIGHSIIVTFGNYPLKTYFTPSFKVSLYKTGAIDLSKNKERLFEEDKIFYDITIRNKAICVSGDPKTPPTKAGKPIESEEVSENPEDLDASSADIDDMIDKYREWRLENPDASIEEFYMNMATQKEAKV